jgi:hypothetical protein
MKQKEFTLANIEFLKKINLLLTMKEKELLERCRKLFEIYEPRLIKNGGDLDDYELIIAIEYRLPNYRPRYCYETTVNKYMEDGFPDLFATDEDWREGKQPDWGNKWCYLMHSLWEHSSIDASIYNIISVDVELHIIEQQFVLNQEFESFC